MSVKWIALVEILDGRIWGQLPPVYDAVPDTDHGANILNQLQKMVMQVEGGKDFCAAGTKTQRHCV